VTGRGRTESAGRCRLPRSSATSPTRWIDFQPTTQQVTVHDELKEQAATYRQRLKLLLEKDVAGFNALLRQRNVPNIITDLQ